MKKINLLITLLVLIFLIGCSYVEKYDCRIENEKMISINDEHYFLDEEILWQPIELENKKLGYLYDYNGNELLNKYGKKFAVYGYDVTPLIIMSKVDEMGAVETYYYSSNIIWPEFTADEVNEIELKINEQNIIIDDKEYINGLFSSMHNKIETRPDNLNKVGQITFINDELYESNIAYTINLLEGDNGLYCSEKHTYGTYYYKLPDLNLESKGV